MRQIGVSLALPEECGRELQEYRIGLGDDQARGIPSHITLVPPQEIDQAAYDVVVAQLESASRRHHPFEVRLCGTGTFRPVSPVVFINVVKGISDCELLAADVKGRLAADDPEFPYHPHVTIAHHLAEDQLDRAFSEMADFECEFEASSFWLYVFDDPTGWTKAQEFQLGR